MVVVAVLESKGQNVSCPNFINFSQLDASFVSIGLLILAVAHVRLPIPRAESGLPRK